MKQKAVITGIGTITPLGNNPSDLWEAIKRNDSGIKRINKMEVSNYSSQFGGQITDFKLRNLNVTGKNMMLRYNQLEIYSVLQALQESNWLDDDDQDKFNCKVYCGNQVITFDYETLETILLICSQSNKQKLDYSVLGDNLKQIPPLNGVKLLPTASSHFIAKNYNCHGAGNLLHAGEISGLATLIMAAKEIEAGYTNNAIVTSSFSPFTPHEFRWFSDLIIAKHTSELDNPELLISPFDANHNGTIFSEGAATILLENEENAMKNEHTIIGEIIGGNTNIFPGASIEELSPSGFKKNWNILFDNINYDFADIDLIYGHGISYPEWDIAELTAISEIWNNTPVKITSSKGHLGYTGCVSGLIDSILALKTMSENKYIPPRNFIKPAYHYINEKYFVVPENSNSLNNCLVVSAGTGGFYSSIIIKNRRHDNG